MCQDHVHGVGKHLMAKHAHVVGRHRAPLTGPLLRQPRHKLVDIKGKVIVLVAEMLVERRAADHGALAQHGNRKVLKAMLFE